MNGIRVRAYGKVNIGLDITGVRDDGYHLIKTVFQTVGIYDEVLVRKSVEGIQIKTNLPFIPNDERNIAYKAAKRVMEKYGIDAGVRIDIGKKIPVGGGMAGGSTDGAAVINAMDRLFKLNMRKEDAEEIAVGIGADVAFCLRKGCFLAEGIGEKLTKLKDMPQFHVLIYAPPFSVSTKWAYQRYDEETEKYHPDMEGLLDAIYGSSAEGIAKYMGNSLEPVVAKQYPDIKTIINKMEEAGAKKAMMSGSGSTVFGLFDSKKEAKAACDKMKDGSARRLFITDFIKGD